MPLFSVQAIGPRSGSWKECWRSRAGAYGTGRPGPEELPWCACTGAPGPPTIIWRTCGASRTIGWWCSTISWAAEGPTAPGTVRSGPPNASWRSWTSWCGTWAWRGSTSSDSPGGACWPCVYAQMKGHRGRLASLVLSAPTQQPLWDQDQRRHVAGLPEKERSAILDYEAWGTTPP